MSKTIRIRTTPNGTDKYIKVPIEQDFDFIEVLSLRISQEEAYRNFCADYGVIVGRVVINSGFGVPNAKVSVFIPIDDIDKEDPLISGLYPYEVVTDKNIDGIRYNLLSKKPETDNNCFTPVGTLPDKRETIDNEVLNKIYCKYYKFTTTTNHAGDFMVFGVPLGTYTVHIDADISDIGIASQRPYDLINQGSSEKLFESTTKFKGGTNLDKLPQIKTANIGVNVNPFWGNAETCEIGITRVDFDTNLQINTTSLFLGSIFTDSGKMSLNLGCNPKNDQGEQDNFKTGAGVIKMIRAKEYNITDWVNTNSITPLELEEFDVEGGELIDDDGTFAFPLPMNIGHVITDEFGNLIPSNNPEVGIATKGLYRFKMNFTEPNENPKFRTAHMLFPSLGKDFGGTGGSVNGGTQGGTEDQRFTTDINAYNDINKDFHLFEFKQLYTIAHYIKKYKKGFNRFSFLGIKNTDVTTETNPFPYTNAMWKFDLLYYILAFFVEFVAILLKFLAVLINLCFGFCLTIWLGLDKRCITFLEKELCIPNERITFANFDLCISICPFKWLGGIIGTINLPCETRPNGQIPIDFQSSSDGCCGNQSGLIQTGGQGNCEKVFNSPRFNTCFKPSDISSLPTVKDIEDWVCCAKISIAESRNVIRRVFFDAWVLGTAYLFQFKYKKKIKKSTGQVKKEKFCGPGADHFRGDDYKRNKCCLDSGNGSNCDKCLLRGPNTTKNRTYAGIENYHEIYHNSSITGANDINDVIYCNALMSTKIVSLGRIEMCEETLEQIDNSIQASQALTKYVQSSIFYTGTF